MSNIVFFDLEINEKKQILDIGAIRSDGATFHKNNPAEFLQFIEAADFICGHNIFAHDLLYFREAIQQPAFGSDNAIDTLLLSPLLFPKRPYHRLLKDDKLQVDELNNPLNASYLRMTG